MIVITDLDLEVRRLNAVGEPLLHRIDVGGLIARHGREAVRAAFIREAERFGAVSIARAPRWRESRRFSALKAG
jgi:hypothetical protein